MALRTRRSYGQLVEPAPSDEQIHSILEAAAASPDHGALRPVRFTLLRGATLDSFGAVLESAYVTRCHARGEAPDPAKAERERAKLHRAPLVVVVSAARQSSEKIPWVDQRDAAVAAAMALLLAAHAHGYGAMWRTGDVCDDEQVKQALGRATNDAVVGFIYIGTPLRPKEPRQIDLEGLVEEFVP